MTPPAKVKNLQSVFLIVFMAQLRYAWVEFLFCCFHRENFKVQPEYPAVNGVPPEVPQRQS